jgi:hypothetical protein
MNDRLSMPFSLSVILSAAKDLTPIGSGDKVLRFAQDDNKH